ncbi:MAG TPA: TetR/AcrR family transcriptional regulator [Terriglobales bacterium]|nr:TetR/AcrR family transcriptional regulator [Terriglobales bacterium]
MARPPDPRIRARLREQAVDYVLSHGMNDLALRPLAKALGTNARMLVYHFGSREGLMREILLGLREREGARMQAWFQDGKKPHTLSEFLRWLWRRLSKISKPAHLQLLFELYALALRHPKDYPGVLEDPLVHWKAVTKRTSRQSKTHDAMATLLLAATRGLLLDLCATGDRARTEGALNLLARFVESSDATTKAKSRLSKPRGSHHSRNKKHEH